MKKLSNMQTLKNLVNADVLECIKCRIYGVQAYNISANEYEVIGEFAKQGGRYYFIDRDGNRYLASRYDRAEDVAAGILENIECTKLVVNALADQIQKNGKVAVNSEVLDLFFDECDRRGFGVESVENHYHDNGEMFTVYRLKDEQGTAQTAKTAGRYARIAWRWLNTRHLFGDDSEAVALTGWQYIGVAAVAIVCGLLFSIKL